MPPISKVFTAENPFFNLLEVSIGRDFGALKSFKDLSQKLILDEKAKKTAVIPDENFHVPLDIQREPRFKKTKKMSNFRRLWVKEAPSFRHHFRQEKVYLYRSTRALIFCW